MIHLTAGNRSLVLSALFFFVVPAAVGAQCEYRIQDHREVLSTWDTTNHRSGRHSVKATAKFRCVCDHTCRSRCTPSWDVKSCRERGLLKGAVLHVRHVKEKMTIGSTANAIHGSGTDCGAGYGCFVQECTPGNCGSFPIDVSVKPVGVGVSTTFTARRVPLWDGQLDFPFECDACSTSRGVTEELRRSGKEYIPYDDGDYASGSGSVYKSCYWECESWMDSRGHYQEYCELVECLTF